MVCHLLQFIFRRLLIFPNPSYRSSKASTRNVYYLFLHISGVIQILTTLSRSYNTDVPQLSERAILEHAKYLSEDIGYRTVGTREHALADAWMLKKAEELKTLCEDIVRKEPGRKLQCEVDRQTGNGEHR